MAGRILALLAIALPGCTYITQAAFENRRGELDDDGDGVPYASDCNDQDALKAPSAAEVPYDGVDNDCDGADLVDVDGDGFPGILEADYAAKDPEEPFPQALAGKPLDCADDPAVVPTAAEVHPDPSGA